MKGTAKGHTRRKDFCLTHIRVKVASMETTITLPFAPNLVWGTLGLLGVVVASTLAFVILPKNSPPSKLIEHLRIRLGLANFPVVVFLVAAMLWIGIVGVLTGGLIGLILAVLTLAAPNRTIPTEVWDFRFMLVQITALTTVLGAAIALPLTMSLLHLQKGANDTADESLFNEKINAATQGLYARRQVTKWKRKDGYEHIWQDDIVQRAAAIDRLEGLAKEEPNEVPRIARLLSVYVRELSAEVQALPAPRGVTPNELRDWANKLPKLRSDMEKAAQTLGRLNTLAETPLANGEIDLRGANLQKADLNGLDFGKALLSKTQLQGAYLGRAQLQGANLYEAQLQGANLKGANLEGARLGKTEMQVANLRGACLNGASMRAAQLQQSSLRKAQLEGADLWHAQLQAANLWGATLNVETNLTRSNLRFARVKKVDLGSTPINSCLIA